jgi:hypothetical protein
MESCGESARVYPCPEWEPIMIAMIIMEVAGCWRIEAASFAQEWRPVNRSFPVATRSHFQSQPDMKKSGNCACHFPSKSQRSKGMTELQTPAIAARLASNARRASVRSANIFRTNPNVNPSLLVEKCSVLLRSRLSRAAQARAHRGIFPVLGSLIRQPRGDFSEILTKTNIRPSVLPSEPSATLPKRGMNSSLAPKAKESSQGFYFVDVQP